MAEHMLTTVDNPYDPFTQYPEWYAFDTNAGYHTSAFLARVISTSPNISNTDQSLAIEQAIDEIVRENVSGMHKKVRQSD